MKALLPSLLLCLCAAFAQQAPLSPVAPGMSGVPALPNLPEDTVIAVFDDGGKLTMGELRSLVEVMPPENRQSLLVQQKEFVRQWALMRKLALMAEKDGLERKSPLKEQLLYSRQMLLGQAKLAGMLNSNIPSPEEIEKYYEANKSNFKMVTVKAIYVAFGDSAPAGAKKLTEADAKAKAEKLLEQIRSGADFAKMVKENSDDETSREKDGDFATFRSRDNIPDAIREAVFSMKKGDTVGPVKQANGFYLLRAADVTYSSLDDLRSELVGQVQREEYVKWLEGVSKSVNVEFPNPGFPPK
jgi:peptidyl-prolyl cis-trans isomerase C